MQPEVSTVDRHQLAVGALVEEEYDKPASSRLDVATCMRDRQRKADGEGSGAA
jgi:hypothetical protein